MNALNPHTPGTQSVLIISLSLMLNCFPGCQSQSNHKQTADTVMTHRDITAVQEAHTKELMDLPGVVGVYLGALENGSACIVVMVKKKTPELVQRIPTSLEGYPVTIEETGEIRPMK